jgi:hypothetical protein
VTDLNKIDIAAELLKDNFFAEDVPSFMDSPAAPAAPAEAAPSLFDTPAATAPSGPTIEFSDQPASASGDFDFDAQPAAIDSLTSSGGQELGNLLEEPPAPVLAAQPPAPVASQPDSATASINFNESAPQIAQPARLSSAATPAVKQGGSKGLLIGIAAAAVVLIVGAVVAFLVLGKGGQQPAEPATPTKTEQPAQPVGAPPTAAPAEQPPSAAPAEAPPAEQPPEAKAPTPAEAKKAAEMAKKAAETPAAKKAGEPPAVAIPVPVAAPVAPVAPEAPAVPTEPQFKLRVTKIYNTEAEAAADRAVLAGMGMPVNQQTVQADGESTYLVTINQVFAKKAEANVAGVKLEIFSVPYSINEKADGSAVVIIGSFPDETKANEMKTKTTNAGFPSSITPRATRVTKYTLTAGKFFTRQEAETALNQARGSGIDATIVGY